MLSLTPPLSWKITIVYMIIILHGCYLYGEGRICMMLLCAALGDGKHGVPFPLVMMSVQQKLQWENIRKIKQRYSCSVGVMKVFWL